MNIIDAHHHLWAPFTPETDLGYVWLKDIGAMKPFGDPTPIQRDYLLDEFLGEDPATKLAGSVHLQVDPRIPDPVAETALIQSLSDASGHPIMTVGFVDLAAPEAEKQLKWHCVYPNFRGVRQILSHLPERPEISFSDGTQLSNPTWQRNFASFAELGLSFDLMLYPEQMPQAAAFLAKHPGVPVVLEHLGSPYDTTPEGMARWHKGMKALAALPHVHVKLSGYAMYFQSHLSGAAIEVTQAILEMFGPNRVMFGSNFPVDKLHLTYADVVAFMKAQVPSDSLEAVMGANASKFYKFNL
jgi:predicted TIM-barrel fold metal-dependent hydrolase